MLIEPNCNKRHCKHFQGGVWLGDGEETETIICTAFPKGIPPAIAYGDNLHTKPYPGDNGIQFEELKEKQ